MSFFLALLLTNMFSYLFSKSLFERINIMFATLCKTFILIKKV